MKKNKILGCLVLLLSAATLSSCLKEDNEIFDQSASKRLSVYLQETKDVLTGAEYGWHLNYVPDRNQSYGGYNYTLKFDDQNVEARFDLASPSDSIVSTYTLSNEDGPVLLFDTYNEFLHCFSTPTGSSGAGGYEAYDGDHMFLILNISENKDTITLKGTRSGNKMTMIKLTKPARSFMQDIENIVSNMSYSYYFSADTMQILQIDAESRHIYFDNYLTEEEQESMFKYSETGIELFTPFSFGGRSISSLTFDATDTLVVGAEGKLVLKPFIPASAIDDVFSTNSAFLTDWYLSYNYLCPAFQSEWETAKNSLYNDTELFGEAGTYLDFVCIEEDVLYFSIFGYYFTFSIDYVMNGDGTVTIAMPSPKNNNAKFLVQELADFKKFYSILEGTYRVEYGNATRSQVRLTNVKDESLYIELWKAAVYPY